MTERERKNKRVGMAVSLGVHLAVLLFFAFLMAWTAPDPPLPEYGIEINFGTSDAGTGNVQPPVEATPAESNDDAKPEELPVEEKVEETQETPVEDTETEEATESTEQIQEVFDDEQSSDVVKEEEKVQEEVKEIEEKKEPPPSKEVTEQNEAEKPIEKVEKTEEVVDTGAEGKDGDEKVTDANQGDKTDAVGDQGREKGTIDSRALYGTPGGGGGSALRMAGWQWDLAPKPDDTTSETGKIVFEITIDDDGEIINILTIESSVSLSVKKVYEDEVRSLTFSKTDNLPPAPTSKGRITFIITAK